jgi:MFS family permease
MQSADAAPVHELFHLQMAATVGVYMFTVGATALFWGPFCDRYGRCALGHGGGRRARRLAVQGH